MQVGKEVREALKKLQFWISPSVDLTKSKFLNAFMAALEGNKWNLRLDGKDYSVLLSGTLNEDGLKARAKAIATSLVDSITTRFKNLDILDAFICFEPCFYVGVSDEDLEKFLFANEFNVLKSHFCGTVFFSHEGEASLDSEFLELKSKSMLKQILCPLSHLRHVICKF
jgi:hypothetical protein